MEQLSFNYTVPPAVRGKYCSIDRLEALAGSWSIRFHRFFRPPCRITFHDNSSTMISSRIRDGILQLRLHHMFLGAEESDLKALASYLRGDRRGATRLDRFIEQNMNKVRRRLDGDTHGDMYDLLNIRDALNRVYFDSPQDVTVVWGAKANTRKKRSIRLGSYAFDDKLVRINSVLDQKIVPAYVVVSVVYHEMLHHALGVRYKNGKRLLHSKEFKLREKKYVHYALSEEWIKNNLSKLLKRQRLH